MIEVHATGHLYLATGDPDELHVHTFPELVTADVALRETGASVVVPGPMYDGHPPRSRFRLYDRATNVDIRSRDDGGATVSILDGRATVSASTSTPLGASVIVQGYPWLVRHGEPAVTGQLDTERVARCALGVVRDGHVALAYSVGSTLSFARELIAKNVVNAVYLDGGRVGSFASTIEAIPLHIGTVGAPTWLTLGNVARATPDRDQRANKFGAVLALIVAALLVRRGRR
jgi:hypothetical protein